jgi:hypothetical protein
MFARIIYYVADFLTVDEELLTAKRISKFIEDNVQLMVDDKHFGDWDYLRQFLSDVDYRFYDVYGKQSSLVSGEKAFVVLFDEPPSDVAWNEVELYLRGETQVCPLLRLPPAQVVKAEETVQEGDGSVEFVYATREDWKKYNAILEGKNCYDLTCEFLQDLDICLYEVVKPFGGGTFTLVIRDFKAKGELSELPFFYGFFVSKKWGEMNDIKFLQHWWNEWKMPGEFDIEGLLDKVYQQSVWRKEGTEILEPLPEPELYLRTLDTVKEKLYSIYGDEVKILKSQ